MKKNAFTLRDQILVLAVVLSGLAFAERAAPAPLNAASGTEPAARWSFDRVVKGKVIDQISGTQDSLTGNYRLISGIRGKAVKFDGYTTMVIRRAKDVPSLDGAFTLSAWIAIAAYPWNWCPVINHAGLSSGYSLEIGPDGEVRLKVFSGSAWRTVYSKDRIKLRAWSLVSGVFDPDRGLTVYINGLENGHMDYSGRMSSARDSNLIIGSVRQPEKPSDIHREFGTLPGWFSLDAALDEVEIWNGAQDEPLLTREFAQNKPSAPPEIPPRILPRGAEGPGRFGAYYTRLKYYWEWDDLWRVGDDPDIVVCFDRSPVRMVFWRGTRYSPVWVTENNLWMADQSIEAWNDEEGCFEHMQDRHTRYSHVRIIENTPARAVIHWRYAPVSAYNHLWNVDPRTGWGLWIDEYYYIYPDQTGIRKYVWTKGALGQPRQFQESIPLTGPGQLQGDVVNKEYVTIANLEGQRQVFSYVADPPRETEKKIPENPCIQRHNLKADNKPFIVFEPGGKMFYLRDINITALSRPGSCSHWPVGQMCCDGRTQRTADRAASFLGFPITDPVVHEGKTRSWANSLYGMNAQPFDTLISLARSWARAPDLEVLSGKVKSLGYDMSQRAYRFDCEKPMQSGLVKLRLNASEESPVVNACLVFDGWGNSVPAVSVDGRSLNEKNEYKTGFVRTLEGTNLIVWIELKSNRPVKVEIDSSLRSPHE